jgi:hypothetical protein
LNDDYKVDEKGRACSTHGEKWNAYRILVGNQKKGAVRKTKT